MAETLSTTNMPPPRNDCLCAGDFLSQKWPHIVAALSIITLLGAIFTLLAAYKLLPPDANLVSNYAWSKALGFGFMAVGILTGIAAILGRLCPLNRRPNHIVVEVNEPATVAVQRGEESVLIPFSLHESISTWLYETADKDEVENRHRAIDSIIDCYAKKEKMLFLSGLTSLPDIFQHLNHIDSLTLSCCSPSLVLNAPIYKLKNLKELTVRNLKLADDDNMTYDWSPFLNQLSHLGSLRSLTLMANSIKKLPDSIKLENLTFLSLTGNSLTELPLSLSHLSRLEYLYLSSNHFNSLPDWLFKLPTIKVIDATGNLFSPKIVISLCEKVKPLIVSGKITQFNISSESHDVNSYTLLEKVYFPADS